MIGAILGVRERVVKIAANTLSGSIVSLLIRDYVQGLA